MYVYVHVFRWLFMCRCMCIEMCRTYTHFGIILSLFYLHGRKRGVYAKWHKKLHRFGILFASFLISPWVNRQGWRYVPNVVLLIFLIDTQMCIRINVGVCYFYPRCMDKLRQLSYLYKVCALYGSHRFVMDSQQVRPVRILHKSIWGNT